MCDWDILEKEFERNVKIWKVNIFRLIWVLSPGRIWRGLVTKLWKRQEGACWYYSASEEKKFHVMLFFKIKTWYIDKNFKEEKWKWLLRWKWTWNKTQVQWYGRKEDKCCNLNIDENVKEEHGEEFMEIAWRQESVSQGWEWTWFLAMECGKVLKLLLSHLCR